MSQLFRLQLTDGVESVDFLSSIYLVEDGEFNIGLAKTQRTLVPYYSNFYVPVSNNYQYRDAKIGFEIRGPTRHDVIESLHKIERLLGRALNRSRYHAGQRVELSYSWEGADNLTYFEVYGGDVSFPDDILSVAKIHWHSEGRYGVANCQLNLYLSAFGYGVSLYKNIGSLEAVTYEIPLYNHSIASKTTGGIVVGNPGGSNNHYVMVDGDDVPGSSPWLTRWEIGPGATFSRWSHIYMGQQVYPYTDPYSDTSLLLDNEDTRIQENYYTDDDDTDAYNGSVSGTSLPEAHNPGLAMIMWATSRFLKGMYFTFLHTLTKTTTSNVMLAVGTDSYVTTNMRYVTEFVKINTDHTTHPIASIHWPPGNIVPPATYDYLDISFALFHAADAAHTIEFDYLTFLPIRDGFRILRSRDAISNQDFTAVDDAWQGQEYSLHPSVLGTSNPWYGLMEPIKLQPGLDQVVCFQSIGADPEDGKVDRNRLLNVRLFGVPTYLTLAM